MLTIDQLLTDRTALAEILAELRLLREALARSPAQVAIYSPDDRLVYWNAAFAHGHAEAFERFRDRIERRELTYAELLRLQIARAAPAERIDADVARRLLERRERSGLPVERYYPATGFMRVYEYPLASGATAAFAFDITTRRTREAELAEAWRTAEAAERRLADAIDVIPEALAIYNADRDLVTANKRFRATVGDDDVSRVRVAEALDEQAKLPRPSERALREDRYVRIHANHTQTGDLVGCFVDITELKRTQHKLEAQARALERINVEVERRALHDPLTNLPNRTALDQFISAACARATTFGEGFALLSINLDRFKPINDTLGFDAGDHVLLATASRLKAHVGADDFLARIGGDEFVLVLPGRTDVDDVSAFATELVRVMASPVDYLGMPCRIGSSLGIVVVSGDDAEVDAREIVINAGIALDRAKEQGSGRIEVFCPALQQHVVERRALADQLLVALETEAFFPVYQPQFRVGDLSLRGVEVLCRWRRPDGGVSTPADFADVAVTLDIDAEIDRQILAQVQVDLKRLEAHGVHIPMVAFNVAPKRLFEPCLDVELGALRALGVDVGVELLESMSLDVLDGDLRAAIGRMRKAGIRVEIDDFGSCRASIVSLMSVAPDAMKIDRQLIAPITSCDQHRRLVQALIDVGAALNIEVVAEGVETVEHVRALSAMGCDALQGFALSRPMGYDALPAFLEGGSKRADQPKRRTGQQTTDGR